MCKSFYRKDDIHKPAFNNFNDLCINFAHKDVLLKLIDQSSYLLIKYQNNISTLRDKIISDSLLAVKIDNVIRNKEIAIQSLKKKKRLENFLLKLTTLSMKLYCIRLHSG